MIRFSRSGRRTILHRVWRAVGAFIGAVVLSMSLVPQPAMAVEPAVLRGVVVDRDGEGIADASVQLCAWSDGDFDCGDIDTVSTSDGTFSIQMSELDPATSYGVRIHADGYWTQWMGAAPEERPEALADGNHVETSDTDVDLGQIQLQKQSHLTGTAVDSSDRAISEISVCLFASQLDLDEREDVDCSMTDSEGAFSLEIPSSATEAEGDYYIQLRDSYQGFETTVLTHPIGQADLDLGKITLVGGARVSAGLFRTITGHLCRM